MACASCPADLAPQLLAAAIAAFPHTDWRCRLLVISFLKSFAYIHHFLLTKEDASTLRQFALESALPDPQLEVREAACTLMVILIRSDSPRSLEKLCTTLSKSILKGKRLRNGEAVVPRHAAVLGLTAMLHTSPYDVPSFMPQALASLARCSNDAAPVNTTVRKAFGEFWRTHQESWAEYRERFSEEELEYVSEMIAPGASYYA